MFTVSIYYSTVLADIYSIAAYENTTLWHQPHIKILPSFVLVTFSDNSVSEIQATRPERSIVELQRCSL